MSSCSNKLITLEKAQRDYFEILKITQKNTMNVQSIINQKYEQWVISWNRLTKYEQNSCIRLQPTEMKTFCISNKVDIKNTNTKDCRIFPNLLKEFR